MTWTQFLCGLRRHHYHVIAAKRKSRRGACEYAENNTAKAEYLWWLISCCHCWRTTVVTAKRALLWHGLIWPYQEQHRFDERPPETAHERAAALAIWPRRYRELPDVKVERFS